MHFHENLLMKNGDYLNTVYRVKAHWQKITLTSTYSVPKYRQTSFYVEERLQSEERTMGSPM